MTAKSTSRSAARLAAVQALFQHQMEKTPVTKLIKEFHDHRLGQEIEDDQYHPAEGDFFDDLVIGVASRLEEIDALVDSKLAKGWTLGRLDKTMLQILRCGTFELVAYDDVPIATVIDEYLDVAHAFFNKKDAGFVNGLLDSIAKQVRG
ncbi:transcription antitermination factor NusB [Parasphingorhabdus flavimaris]|jgi:transcription antitermination protein NusB|uniref:Transcription antitermination protein NusB n=1 Tax=Parasphingorhabdus flavimaris TaxID=266812 RepID=A0ABX2MYS5_9SPHN|nr:transcription antitermination factor NusB [Parasphingorhabdus flavimaris]NVD26596.1 transcription antitermination factor NusB [Parasphingorhabdus flavimaris]|tara:strand:+ start:3523 stop:3969 length:447 start_codon:yes stop_codon:yes gene_type:complete